MIDLEAINPNEEGTKYISVYEELFGKEPKKIDYSGILVVPNGYLIGFENFGYSYLYDKYLLFTIGKDRVFKTKEVNKDEFLAFKTRQFEAYKKSEYFEKDMREMITMKPSPKKLKGKSKKAHQKTPNRQEIEAFLFHTKNIDFIIVDY